MKLEAKTEQGLKLIKPRVMSGELIEIKKDRWNFKSPGYMQTITHKNYQELIDSSKGGKSSKKEESKEESKVEVKPKAKEEKPKAKKATKKVSKGE